jgi:ketosteroid isomerase-like protein
VSDPASVFRQLIDTYGRGDLDAMRTLLADDLVAYVTNGEGGVDRVDGADGYLGRVPVVADARYSATVTQVVTPAEDQALGMVEIRAERPGKTLHNHAAFLARVRQGRVTELWMVDALPAPSDEFWSQ